MEVAGTHQAVLNHQLLVMDLPRLTEDGTGQVRTDVSGENENVNPVPPPRDTAWYMPDDLIAEFAMSSGGAPGSDVFEAHKQGSGTGLKDVTERIAGFGSYSHSFTSLEGRRNIVDTTIQVHGLRFFPQGSVSIKTLRQRLDNANDHFRRKASEVFNDEAAMRLLTAMYRDVVVEVSDFDSGLNGLAMARLTAANFCEIGANVIYITDAGQRFMNSIEGAWKNRTTHSDI